MLGPFLAHASGTAGYQYVGRVDDCRDRGGGQGSGGYGKVPGLPRPGFASLCRLQLQSYRQCMAFSRYLPEGGRQVPPDGTDPDAADANRHPPRETGDIMAELIAEHQLEGDGENVGWLRRLIHRRRVRAQLR
jgi:hypothetical protein